MPSAAGGTSLWACGWVSVWILLLQLPGCDPGSAEMAYRIGDTVHLSGNRNVSESDDVHWKFKRGSVTRPIKNNQDYHYSIENGTLHIHKGNKNHSGLYSVEIYNKYTGTCLVKEDFHVNFFEQISKLRVLSSCPEGKNTTVTCSADSGDDVHFLWKWTLNGTEQSVDSHPEKRTVKIWFEDDSPDGLVCEARNALGVIRAEVQVCRGHLWKLVAGLGFLVVCLCVGLLTVRKKRNTVDKSGTEDVYLDMTGQHQNKPRPQNLTAPPPDPCIYEQLNPLRKTQPPPSPPSQSLQSSSPSPPSPPPASSKPKNLNIEDIYVL